MKKQIVKLAYALEIEHEGILKAFKERISFLEKMYKNDDDYEDYSEIRKLICNVDAILDHISWTLMYKGYEESEEREEVAKIINYSRQYYSSIERGEKRGSVEFYQRIQDKFDLTDAETWELTKNT